MLLLTAEQAARVHALAKEIIETLDKSHHISLDAPVPVKQHPAAIAAVERKTSKRAGKRRKRLTADKVQEIKQALSAGMSKAAVSRQYNASYSTVFKIAKGDLYKKVQA